MRNNSRADYAAFSFLLLAIGAGGVLLKGIGGLLLKGIDVTHTQSFGLVCPRWESGPLLVSIYVMSPHYQTKCININFRIGLEGTWRNGRWAKILLDITHAFGLSDPAVGMWAWISLTLCYHHDDREPAFTNLGVIVGGLDPTLKPHGLIGIPFWTICSDVKSWFGWAKDVSSRRGDTIFVKEKIYLFGSILKSGLLKWATKLSYSYIWYIFDVWLITTKRVVS
ncbi:hypothetical protein L1887_07564 [Cichorium endivia]|nr:hypothetical protein L1887_07564 [Cichorium endivia]